MKKLYKIKTKIGESIYPSPEDIIHTEKIADNILEIWYLENATIPEQRYE